MTVVALVFAALFAALAAMLWHSCRKLEAEKRRLSLSESSLMERLSEAVAEVASCRTALKTREDMSAMLQCRNDELRGELSKAQADIRSLSGALAADRTKLDFFEKEKARMAEENEIRFKNLATEILRQNAMEFKAKQEEHLGEILRPLHDNIEQFKKTFAESYDKESRERFALDKHIQQLVELNRSIGKEAQDLTRALRGNSKVQGDWGEMILEGILQRSGLERGREYTIQECTSDTGGRRLRADVIINYPDGRRAVIDSKVSLTEYVNYVNAEEKEERQAALSAHLRSVRSHIAELRDKNYQDYFGDKKSDFVMMFIPNEGAYLAAMNADNAIWQEAYDSRVIIISPTHLISVIKLVEQLWQHDRQTRNALDIAKSAGAMLDKFSGFLEDMLKIEKCLNGARDSFDAAMKKLSTGTGNLITRARKLKDMGAKTSKMLPVQSPDAEE